MRRNIDEAVEEVRRDPARPVRVRIDDLEIEIRVVPSAPTDAGLGDRLAAAGPWEGERVDEILALLREGREHGGSAEAPDL